MITLQLILSLLLSALMVGMTFAVRDNLLKVTKALPNGAASIVSDAFHLGHSATGTFLTPCELVLEAPALAVGELANGATMTYELEHDTDPAFGTATTFDRQVIVQTGAGGAGAAAATKRVRLPTDVKPYVRVKATNSAAGNASGKSLTARLVF